MIGRTIGRYRITVKLGDDATGSVWKAEDALLRRTLALRLPSVPLPLDPAAREHFLREAQTMSRSHHAGISGVYDAGEADGVAYIAMQLDEVAPPPARRKPRRHAGSSRRHIAAIAAAGAILLVAAATLLLWKRGAPWRHPEAPYDSVAVLPLRNLSPDPAATDYLAEGVGEALAGTLTQVAGLRVEPWITVRRYANTEEPLPELASEMSVRALVVGTFRSTGNRISGSLALVDGKSGLQFWAGDFNEVVDDIFSVQRRIAVDVAMKLRGTLTPPERAGLERPSSQNVAAYQFYLQGVYAMRGDTPSSREPALALFTRALALDSTLAEAALGVGAVQSGRYFSGMGGEEALHAARTYFEQALALRPGLPQAIRGLIQVEWNEGHSEACLQLAKNARDLGIDPVERLLVQGEAEMLAGRPDRGAAAFRRVLEIAPANQSALWWQVPAAAWAGEYGEAQAVADSYLRRYGEDPEIHLWAAVAHEQQGHAAAAAQHFDACIKQQNDVTDVYAFGYTAAFLRKQGRARDATTVLQRGLDVALQRLEASPDNLRLRTWVAILYAFLGRRADFLAEERRALAQSPNHAGAIAQMGYGYAALGDAATACARWRQGARGGWATHVSVIQLWQAMGFDSIAASPDWAAFVQDMTDLRARWDAQY